MNTNIPPAYWDELLIELEEVFPSHPNIEEFFGEYDLYLEEIEN